MSKLEPLDYIANRHSNGEPGAVKYMISEEDWLAIKDEVRSHISAEVEAFAERLKPLVHPHDGDHEVLTIIEDALARYRKGEL